MLEMGGEVTVAQNWEWMEDGEAWASPWQGRESNAEQSELSGPVVSGWNGTWWCQLLVQCRQV